MLKKISVIIIILLFSLITNVNGMIAGQSNNSIEYGLQNPNILYVGGPGPNNYTGIQDAIDNASNGDTVFVFDDSSPYYENLFVNKSIDIIGEDKNTTRIIGSSDDATIGVDSEWVNISNFTVKGGSEGIDLIYSGTKYIKIYNNVISDNVVGIYLKENSFINISSNIIINSTGTCIYAHSSYQNIIINNFIESKNRYGITLAYESKNNIIQKNTFRGHRRGITLAFSSSNTIISNNFINNYRDAFFQDCHNTWNKNYWGRPRLLPKPIFGLLSTTTPKINFDMRPAFKPYTVLS